MYIRSNRDFHVVRTSRYMYIVYMLFYCVHYGYREHLVNYESRVGSNSTNNGETEVVLLLEVEPQTMRISAMEGIKGRWRRRKVLNSLLSARMCIVYYTVPDYMAACKSSDLFPSRFHQNKKKQPLSKCTPLINAHNE